MKSPSSSRVSAGNSGRQPGVSPISRSRAASSRLGRFVEFAKNLEMVQTVSLLMLVLVTIFGFDDWLFRVVSRVCLFVFVLHPRSLRRPQFWFALALAGTISLVMSWERIDNHKYLLDYWLWILFVVHLFGQAEQQQQIVRFSARFFLCLAFLAASGQKLSSPSYRTGAMFEHYLYVDSRFSAFGKLVGIDPSIGDSVKRRIMFLRSPFAEVEGNDIHIGGSGRARVAALVMTWWDVSLQSAIGALLLFGRRRTDELAHILLLFFIFTTYIPAPVFGFGWILAIMGFALAKDQFPRITALYIVSFVAILLYQLPWRQVVVGV